MKILHLTPFFSPNVGGVETHLDDLVAELANNNVASVVLTYQPIMLKVNALSYEKRGELVEIIRYNWFRKIFYIVEPYPLLDFLYLTPYLFVRAFFYLLANRKTITIIHAHGFNAAFIAKFLKLIFRLPVVISTHATYDLTPESSLAKKIKWVLQSANKILTLSEASKHELQKIGLAEDTINVYRYWVDQTVFTMQDKVVCKSKVGFSEAKLSVLFVGRLITKKGVMELIAAAKIIAAAKNDVNFYIAGTGFLDDYVSQQANEVENIHYLGKVNNAELASYYNAADIFIIPSTHEEGFGRVILEALACGTPVLGSNRGGIKEAMTDEVGKLIAVTPENIIEGIYSIKESIKVVGEELYRKKCRLYAEHNYSSKNINLFLKVYNELKSRDSN